MNGIYGSIYKRVKVTVSRLDFRSANSCVYMYIYTYSGGDILTKLLL